MNTQSNVLLQLEGNTNDLLTVYNETMKSTRLIDLSTEANEEDAEVIDVCITSTNDYGHLPKFENLLGKKIRVTVEELS